MSETTTKCPKCGADKNIKASEACAPHIHWKCGSNTSGFQSALCRESMPTFSQLAAVQQQLAGSLSLAEVKAKLDGLRWRELGSDVSIVMDAVYTVLGLTPTPE